MDINGIRLRNYRVLLLEFRARPDQAALPEHGLLTRFAAAAGVSPRYLSHINNGRKNIGDTVARQLESGFALPHGWMDNDHDPELTDEGPEKEFLNAARQLYRESPLEAQAMLMRYMMERMQGKTETQTTS